MYESPNCATFLPIYGGVSLIHFSHSAMCSIVSNCDFLHFPEYFLMYCQFLYLVIWGFFSYSFLEALYIFCIYVICQLNMLQICSALWLIFHYLTSNI